MASNLRNSWSTEDEARLRDLLNSGASPLLVAAKLKRTRSAIKARARNCSGWYPLDEQKAVALITQRSNDTRRAKMDFIGAAGRLLWLQGDFEKQTSAYRKLAPERAAKLGPLNSNRGYTGCQSRIRQNFQKRMFGLIVVRPCFAGTPGHQVHDRPRHRALPSLEMD